MSSSTVRHGKVGMPIRAVTATVVDGPDAGKTCRASTEKLAIGSADGNDLVLVDETVSRYHCELASSAVGVRVRDCGSTNGTHANGVRIETGVIAAGTTLQLGKTRIAITDGDKVTLPLYGKDVLAGLRGRTPVMRRVMADVERAARSDASVLVVGESGTGKEVVARGLHDLSKRSKKPFVAVDCGAMAPNLIASELFGHERGAFTGADQQHIGAFERAHGGTLFLDEIGELPIALQSNLLGALERRRFRRLGGRGEIEIDVRVVSATNRDLRAEVNASTFRLDLYYRLAVVTLSLPPLREHVDDLELLIEHFMHASGHEGPVSSAFDAATMQMLRVHHWPGNVRELRNLVEATLAMGEPPVLDRSAAPANSRDPFGHLLGLDYKAARQQILTEFELQYCKTIFERANGNVSRAAREARMDRTYLLELLQRHGLK